MPTLVLFLSLLLVSERLSAQEPLPRSVDPNIKISLFASEPAIVTPTGIAVDRNGRVFCIESHTHFRPQDYKGPKTDRIRIYDDTSGDGSSDRITTFYEGSTATMNMAFAPDGSLYVATRSSIFCLRDTNSDDKADQNRPIVKLKTKGDYPHNGLSGLAFDGNGLLYFGFGENLGVDYSLVGNDGTTLSGGGEGGNIYSCDLDGNRLRRVATGFWNPFGLAFDRSGSLFAIDNDPDWRPPCRLLHIVNGGDYGYRFSLGRRGTHPFTAWFGELPGTLGLVSGTGEAPSGILRQRSVTAEGKDVFLTTSWGLHSIEKFVLHERGASFISRPETWIKGGNDFRPVGLASAPDGTIYTADLELHRIWKMPQEGLKEPEEFAVINSPRGLTLDPDGNLWVLSTSSKDGQIQKVTPDGNIEPFVKGHPFNLPHNIVRTGDGTFFVTDNYEHCVWKVTADGEKEKWVVGEPMDRPVGLCLSGQNLLIADPHIRTIFSLAPDKKLSVLASSPVAEIKVK